MRKYVQKQRHPRQGEEEADETQVADARDGELDQATSDLLAEIECCLAEAVTDEEAELKRQAKAEWEALHHDATVGFADFWHSREVWAEKYRNVIPMERDCCGVLVPDFSGIE